MINVRRLLDDSGACGLIELSRIEAVFQLGHTEAACAMLARALDLSRISNEAAIGFAAFRSNGGLPAELFIRMASPDQIAKLTPLAFCRPSSLLFGSALEACLDSENPSVGLSILTSLPFKLSRSALAASLRRSDGCSQSAARLARSAQAGLADAALLRMLIAHSDWCGNGIAAAALAERERRALARSSAAAPRRSHRPCQGL